MWYLASILILALVIHRAIRLSKKELSQTRQAFIDRENAANLVARKSLDDLKYINVPLSLLPINLLPDNPKMQECIALLSDLKKQKIVNFTGCSNTDLKFKYGAPNIHLVSRYDHNFTLLVRTLQRFATLLYDEQYVQEARFVLEYAVSIGSDVKATYLLLYQIYQRLEEPTEIERLIRSVKALPALSQKIILRNICPRHIHPE
ncbi:MAG: hypothetical protein LBM69_09710 [Lachnospiraceae bacterium]|jgi:hypothetical protein|nr:hypothetical protein [Lachnospiraceae bacterium]